MSRQGALLEERMEGSRGPRPGRGSLIARSPTWLLAIVLSASSLLLVELLGFGWTVLVNRSWFIESAPESFDPIASFEEMDQHAKRYDSRARFQSMKAEFVQSDGTMNLLADYDPIAEYSFVIQEEIASKNQGPIGTHASAPGGQYAIKLPTVLVYKPGRSFFLSKFTSIRRRPRLPSSNLGKLIEVGEPLGGAGALRGVVEPPRCSFEALWGRAIERGAPRDAVATISYDASGYRFSIPQTKHQHRFDQSCQLK